MWLTAFILFSNCWCGVTLTALKPQSLNTVTVYLCVHVYAWGG